MDETPYYIPLDGAYVTRNEKRETERETKTVRETEFTGFAYKKRGERKTTKIKVSRILINKFSHNEQMCFALFFHIPCFQIWV